MRAALLPLLLAVILPVADAGAVTCGTNSSHSRRCFVSFFQPCKQAGRNEKICHAQADGCRACNDRLFACWKTLKSKSQCGDCSKGYDRCMHPIVEKQNALTKHGGKH